MDFDYELVNDDLDVAFVELEALIDERTGGRLSRARQGNELQNARRKSIRNILRSVLRFCLCFYVAIKYLLLCLLLYSTDLISIHRFAESSGQQAKHRAEVAAIILGCVAVLVLPGLSGALR